MTAADSQAKARNIGCDCKCIERLLQGRGLSFSKFNSAIDSFNRIAGRSSARRRLCIRRGWPVIGRLLARIIMACALVGVSVAAAAQAPLSVPASATVSATPYRINPGDELEILVWGDERLQRSVLVLPDGTFAFPLVGQV